MSYTNNHFELYLFTTDTELAQRCLNNGVDGIIIDWENKEKNTRQEGYPTQINYDTVEDLCRMRKNVKGTILCRVNKFDPNYSPLEINEAIANGADEIFLPMVATREEVEKALNIVNGRCKVAILTETEEAIQIAPSLADLPLSRVYIGLNDLHISRRSSTLFEPLWDGTVAKLKTTFLNFPLGVGGITHPDKGSPIPSRLLIEYYMGLNINFSFLRRSFLKDINTCGIEETLTAIRNDIDNYRAVKKHNAEEINTLLRSYTRSEK